MGLKSRCTSCRSTDVSHFRLTARGTHQICGRCGKDLTVGAVRKWRSTRARNLEQKRSRARRQASRTIGWALIGWAAIVAIMIPLSGSHVIAYARAESPLVEISAPILPDPIETIPEKIDRISADYPHINPERVKRLIGYETAGTFDCTKQSDVRYTFSDPKRGIKKGDRERSFGCAQIHEPDHPDISRAQATDPDFAIRFIFENWNDRRILWKRTVNLLGL